MLRWLYLVWLALYTLVIPLCLCYLYDLKPKLFRRHIPLWLFGGAAFSWVVVNSVIFIPSWLGYYEIRGPELVFAFFFGWAYLWIASLPVFTAFFLMRLLEYGITQIHFRHRL